MTHRPTTAYGRWGLRARIVAWNIASLAILLVVLGFVARFTVRSILMASVQRRLQEEVRSSPPPQRFGERDHQRGGPPGPPPDEEVGFDEERGKGPPRGLDHHHDDSPDEPPEESAPSENIRPTSSEPGAGTAYAVRHFDLTGKPLGIRPLLDAQAFDRAKTGEEEHYSLVQMDGEPVQILTVPYRQQGKIVAVIQAGYPMTEMYAALHGLDIALLLLIPLGLLGAGLGGTYLTARVLQTVRHTAQAAERIGVSREGGLSDRLPVVGQDEFAHLASTFNDLLGRLDTTLHEQQRLLEQQRRFTADASHELKTPLTVIRGMTSLALDTETTLDPRVALEKIDRASVSMAQLVQDLLLLARSDSGQLGTNRIELLVQEMLDRAAGSVLSPGVAIEIQTTDETLAVRGNETELVRVFANLVDNAVRHTVPPGTVRLAATHVGGEVLLRVSDAGIGIAPEHLLHLGERFYRVDSSRTRSDGGTGLGLSICKSIIEAHGGALTIESVLGEGTVVSVRLPGAE